ncbi:MAG TPA: efflux RND transporter periplasmic adaptor subunit [bacterium]
MAEVNVVPVQIAIASQKNLAVTKTFSGTLEGEEQANIVAKISERITGIHVHVGETVRAGQVIISLDKSGATSQFYQTQANFNNAEKNLQRMKSLYEEGAISLQMLDGTQTAFDIAKANFNAARGAVELVTPIDGVITAVNVSIGDLSMPGAVLATVARIKRMKVIFNVNEADVMNLTIGQKVQVYSETNPDQAIEGQIVQLSKSADIRSRSFEIKAMFPNTAEMGFKPGLFCKVDVQISPQKQALVVPNSAIQSDGITNHVFVIHNGRSLRRTIQVGITDGESSEILEGLAIQDTVVTVGVTSVRDSSQIKIVQ